MTQKRKILQWITVLFAAILLLTVAGNVGAATTSGRCGAKLYWSYQESTGTLAFTGTGTMFSYAEQDPPWHAYAKQVQKITFEKGITTISDRAFYGFSNLQTVQLPETVTSVGSSAFEGCVSLTALPLSGGNCGVGENAFRGCTGLKKVEIPEGITIVGAGAFAQCSQAQSLTIPKSLTELGKGALQGCKDLKQFNVAAGNPVFSASGNCLLSVDGVLLMGSESSVIPTDGSVHTIGADAFRNRTELKSVTIPDSVTTIADYAFQGCSGLTQLILGAGLEKVGVGAFQGCTALKQLSLPEGLTEIGTCAFSGCLSLNQVAFPVALESLGSWSFANTAITEVSLSPGVDHVGINPFRGCKALTSISVNYRNRSYKALGNCLISSSDKVLVSGCGASQLSQTDVTTIGRDAFRDIHISVLEIPDRVQLIEDYAFADSTLKEISFGSGLKELRGNPLAGCKELVSISVSGENTTYRASGNCLISGTTLIAGCGSSVIESGITQIGYEAFRGMTILQIILPEGITQIQKRAFFECRRLAIAKLPESLEYIGESAFELSGLERLSLGSLPKIDSYAFLGCYDLDAIYTTAQLTPGTAQNGYVAYYASQVSNEEMPCLRHYVGDTLQGIYVRLADALACQNGWLQLGEDLRENVTLMGDLTVDLAGFQLSGTMDTAGFRFYGMDSTTDGYTCENAGSFTCKTPAGEPVVPQVHATVGDKQYLSIEEAGGYSFHRFYADLVYMTINPTRVGLGYKALFRGDEKVIAQLDPQKAFRYELCLQGYRPVMVYMQAAELTNERLWPMLVYNYRVEEHGETPLSARVSLQLADGTVIQSPERTTTLRALTEYIDKHPELLDDLQLDDLLAMMDAFPMMKTWDVPNMLKLAQ